MRRKYEIVYIFDSALEETEVNAHLDRFHELLKTPEQPEPITGLAHWGRRALAYPIQRKEIGYYVVAHFETDTALLNEFERVVKLDETVLRYLVVINEGLSADRIEHPDIDDALADDDHGDDDEERPRAANVGGQHAKVTEPAPEPDSGRKDSTEEGGE